MNTLAIIVLLLVAIVIYFIPSLIAFSRKHNNRVAILVCNFLFGWTFLGWGICLVWSFTHNVAAQDKSDAES